MRIRKSSERESASPPTRWEGLNKGEQSHQTKVKALDVLRMMCCGMMGFGSSRWSSGLGSEDDPDRHHHLELDQSSTLIEASKSSDSSRQIHYSQWEFGLQDSVERISSEINRALRDIREIIKTGDFPVTLKSRIENENKNIVLEGRNEEELENLLNDIDEKRDILYKIEELGINKIKDLECEMRNVLKQYMLTRVKFSGLLKNDDKINKLVSSDLKMKKSCEEFFLACDQKDFLEAGKWANKILLEHQEFEKRYLNAYFQVQFTSAIERQDLCESEQKQLAEIKRGTSILQVPEKWRMPFVIARGKAMVEKIANLPDKDLDTSKVFNRYKSDVSNKEGKFCVETYKGVRVEENFVEISPGMFSELPYRNCIDIDNYTIIACKNWRNCDPSKVPLQNSEVLYNQLLLVLKKQKNVDPRNFHLKSIIRKNVENYDTQSVIMLCDSKNKLEECFITKKSLQSFKLSEQQKLQKIKFSENSCRKDTYRFEKGSNEYYALLGTPNVYGILYLLKQHQSTFGKREITSIEVESSPPTINGPRKFDIILHIDKCN